MVLYVNGVQVGSGAVSGSLGVALGSFVLGAPAMQGSLDEVAVYGRMLTASQVQGIAVKPGEQKLLARVNQFIDKIKGNGELDKVNQKWLGESMPAVLKKK